MFRGFSNAKGKRNKMNNKITSVRCPLCNKIFMVTSICRSCVCGWSIDGTTIINTPTSMEPPKNNNNKRESVMMNNTNIVGKVTYLTPNTNDAWEVEIDTVTECSKMPKSKEINVELLPKQKINRLMKKYPSIEWLAYLIGDKSDPYTVKDIFIPKQSVTGTSVKNIDCPEWNTLSVIGVIHSHHGMGNGFSGTDHEWINQNHDISLCIAKNGIAGQVRMKTPCGSIKIVPAKVVVKFPKIDYDFEKWMKESSEKISEPAYTTYNFHTNNTNQIVTYRGKNALYDEEKSLMEAMNELNVGPS